MTVERKFNFGGIVFSIASPIPLKEKTGFESFVENGDVIADFTIEVRGEEGIGNGIRTLRNGDTIEAAVDSKYLSGITVTNLLSLANAAHFVIERDAFVLHSSHVSTDKGSILFTAASGTGKSTQAAFWRRARGAVTVNEDRTLVRRTADGYLACGCWATGSGDKCGNVTAPIRAIVMLRQAERNYVREARASEIIRHVIPQCSFDETSVTSRVKLIDLVSGMIGRVPIVELGCINDVSAVYELEKYI